MKCPVCGYKKVKVTDSRPYSNGLKIKRVKRCPSCHVRFDTYERIDTESIREKKSG